MSGCSRLWLVEQQPPTPTGQCFVERQLHDTSQDKTHHQKGPFPGGCPQKGSVNWTVEQKRMPPAYSSSHLFQMPGANSREPLSTRAGCQFPWAEFPHSLSPLLVVSQFLSFGLPLCVANPIYYFPTVSSESHHWHP